MWNYEKKLQYPVKITSPNAKAAQIIISQFGGPYFKKIYIRSTAFISILHNLLKFTTNIYR